MEPEKYLPFEENEISIKANGGTELVKRKIASLVDSELSQDFQVICSRIRQLREDKIRIYWVHDLPEDPETNHLKDPKLRERFHKIVFCGHWQYNNYLTKLGIVPDPRLCVIENGIVPIEKHTKDLTGTIDLCYVSSPQRGLALLVPVFKALAEKYPQIRLHIYSSFKIYGWQDPQDVQALLDDCKNHPQIIYHGTQPNEVIREDMKKYHIYAYPSIWPECNSIAMIEAMSAGLLCVHPNFAGCSDTAGGLTHMYQFVQDPNVHARVFYENLDHAIQNITKEDLQGYLRFVKAYADTRFHIEKAAQIWTDTMKTLKAAYPTPESRKLPELKEMFQYKPFG